MKNKESHIKLVTTDSYENQIDIWYKSHNIIREKTELYCDFVMTLLDIIEETYLGRDVIKTKEEITSHFNWCFKSVITKFEYEKINFKPIGDYYDYFFIFFWETFYLNDNPERSSKIKSFFHKLFDYNQVKNEIEFGFLLELYKLFEQNLIK
jgi:hypothetical protein